MSLLRRVRYCATPCPLSCYAPAISCYAPATPCPVLTSGILLPDPLRRTLLPPPPRARKQVLSGGRLYCAVYR
eukprot:3155128-Rhodomonas_salina.1